MNLNWVVWLKIILVSLIVSGVTSFLLMKFHTKMIEKWMEKFFEEESERIKSYLSRDK